MKRILTSLVLALLFIGVTNMNQAQANAGGAGAPIAIAIHAGSGTINKGDFSEDKELEIRKTLERAVRTGHAILSAGGSSLDAVTKAITTLEDSPHFNAARGAVFNAEGKNELDASIMDGSDLNAGAVAAVHNVRNPILLARKVMMVDDQLRALLEALSGRRQANASAQTLQQRRTKIGFKTPDQPADSRLGHQHRTAGPGYAAKLGNFQKQPDLMQCEVLLHPEKPMAPVPDMQFKT